MPRSERCDIVVTCSVSVFGKVVVSVVSEANGLHTICHVQVKKIISSQLLGCYVQCCFLHGVVHDMKANIRQAIINLSTPCPSIVHHDKLLAQGKGRAAWDRDPRRRRWQIGSWPEGCVGTTVQKPLFQAPTKWGFPNLPHKNFRMPLQGLNFVVAHPVAWTKMRKNTSQTTHSFFRFWHGTRKESKIWSFLGTRHVNWFWVWI